MESGAEIYTTACINKDEVIDAKREIFIDMFKTIYQLQKCFGDNKNIEKACSYIYNYFLLFIYDLNREHDLYDAIIEYLANIDDISNIDDDILDNLSSIFDDIEDSIELRLMLYGDFATHINAIFEYGILTNSNYLFTNYISYLDEKKKNSLLSLIPSK